MSGYNLPDGCTQMDCDRAAEGDTCGKPGHGELNLCGSCDWCLDEQFIEEQRPLDPSEIDATPDDEREYA